MYIILISLKYMSSFCKICINACGNTDPLPISTKTMTNCIRSCDGYYGMDDMRCCLFVFIPCTIIIDVVCYCPRCTINCYKEIKKKKFEGSNTNLKNIITSQPQPIQLPKLEHIYIQ